MKRKRSWTQFIKAISLILIISLLMPSIIMAYEGDNGYDGGAAIQAGFDSSVYRYREVVFLTGEPIIMEGTLTIKKTIKQGNVSAVYNYNLANAERDATLVRVLEYTTIVSEKEFGQEIEESKLARRPTEVVKIGGKIFQLREYTFTRSKIKDKQPAIDFYAGETHALKSYDVTSGGSGRVTVEITGKNY